MGERMIDKNAPPSDVDMIQRIGQPLAEAWTSLRHFLVETYEITPFLQYGGKNYGWNLQHRRGGRPLCEMYPENGSFTALVVLGKTELGLALERLESFRENVRRTLVDTPRHYDGSWLYVHVTDPLTCQQDVQDIEQLVLIKKAPPRRKGGKS